MLNNLIEVLFAMNEVKKLVTFGSSHFVKIILII